MKRTAPLIPAVLLLTVALLCSGCGKETLYLVVWDADQLEHSRTALSDEARTQLVRAAESILKKGAEYSVTFNDATPGSTGDPRDYTTTHAHWWPNPDTSDGYPTLIEA